MVFELHAFLSSCGSRVFAMCMAAVLSTCRMGLAVGIHDYLSRLCSRKVTVELSAEAIYSASQVLFSTTACCLRSH